MSYLSPNYLVTEGQAQTELFSWKTTWVTRTMSSSGVNQLGGNYVNGRPLALDTRSVQRAREWKTENKMTFSGEKLFAWQSREVFVHAIYQGN